MIIMKLKKLLLAICLFPLVSYAQSPAQLVVRVDDMGSFHSANKASIEAFNHGIARTVEVMVVAPWFPEAVKILKDNPQVDVGLHLTFTSEWDSVKWRPLTHCPGLTDHNGYFLPMMSPNPAYPALSVRESGWVLDEVLQEARAQIELALRNLPQISHISGHMGATGFAPEVSVAIRKLASEYNLSVVDAEADKFQYVKMGETAASLIDVLGKLEAGKRYMLVEHPALDNEEMEGVGHAGNQSVGYDRQNVTNLLTHPDVVKKVKEQNIQLSRYNDFAKALPRQAANKKFDKAMGQFLKAVARDSVALHSIMVIKDGHVVAEKWLNGRAFDQPHALFSVTKSFSATAIGFAVDEGLLKVTDKVISFFPEKLPAEVSDNLKKLEIRHLLTMTTGFGSNPGKEIPKRDSVDLVKAFLSMPLEHEPGTFFLYSSMNSYMLSAIIQKVSHQKLADFLYPRLFRPLGITGFTWKESLQGINQGGWGLNLRTEDLAKMGLFFLQRGSWNGKQLLSQAWIDEASTFKVASYSSDWLLDQGKTKKKDLDWFQGYCYQMWRCRNNGFRADGLNGQFIIVLPEKNCVVAMTADHKDMQQQLDLVWKYLYPSL